MRSCKSSKNCSRPSRRLSLQQNENPTVLKAELKPTLPIEQASETQGGCPSPPSYAASSGGDSESEVSSADTASLLSKDSMSSCGTREGSQDSASDSDFDESIDIPTVTVKVRKNSPIPWHA